MQFSIQPLLYNLTHDISYADAGYQFAEKSRMMIILMASRDKKIKKYHGGSGFSYSKRNPGA